MKILAISGSLREDSYNTKLLVALKKLMPKNVDYEILDISNLPMFNEDLEGKSPDVYNLREKVRSADAIIFATPEYNFTTSAAIKNVIDWASRPYGQNSWNDKPAAIISSSPGTLGGVRAQSRLRQILINVNMHPINRPEVVVGEVNKKFDEDGNLLDEHTIEKLKEMIKELVDWTKRIS